MTVTILIATGGYALMSYGWILLKGYDITFRRWISPLNAYQWPASGDIPKVPAGAVFPSAAKS
jgi:hypothetical protein